MAGVKAPLRPHPSVNEDIMFQNIAFWGVVPFCVAAHRFLPVVGRSLLLTVLSLGLIFALNPVGGGLLAGLVVAVYGLLLISDRSASAATKATTRWIGLILVVGNLIAFKYLPPGSVAWVDSIGFPLGISFLSFRLIHVLLECSRGTMPLPKASDYFLYAFFFPIWVAGPIERFEHFLANRRPQVEWSDIVPGTNRVVWGLVKVFFISKTLLPALYLPSVSPDTVAASLDSVSVIELWRYLLVTYAILYCDFSGYSDIAIGLSRLFGFGVIENFNFPFLATNMSDYWRRWHISLAQWCQSYIYMPVLARTRRPTLALYASFFVMGTWHAASPHWILWGMWHATGVTIFRHWDRFRRTHLKFLNVGHPAVALFNNALTVFWVSGAGAFTSLHGKAPIITSFTLLARAVGL